MSNTTDLASVKDIASAWALDEAKVRAIISVFDIPVGGKGPKPTRGVPVNLYHHANFARAMKAVQDVQSEMVTT